MQKVAAIRLSENWPKAVRRRLPVPSRPGGTPPLLYCSPLSCLAWNQHFREARGRARAPTTYYILCKSSYYCSNLHVCAQLGSHARRGMTACATAWMGSGGALLRTPRDEFWSHDVPRIHSLSAPKLSFGNSMPEN